MKTKSKITIEEKFKDVFGLSFSEFFHVCLSYPDYPKWEYKKRHLYTVHIKPNKEGFEPSRYGLPNGVLMVTTGKRPALESVKKTYEAPWGCAKYEVEEGWEEYVKEKPLMDWINGRLWV